MDIKTLLLSSLSQKKPLQYTKYLCVGRKRYFIVFEMNGKFLTVKRIKKIHKKPTLMFGRYKRNGWLRKSITTVPTNNLNDMTLHGTSTALLPICAPNYDIPHEGSLLHSTPKIYLNKMTNTKLRVLIDIGTITDEIQRKDSCILTEQLILHPQITQTTFHTFQCKSTETNPLIVVNRDQQTDSKIFHSESTQSVLDLVSCGIETEKYGVTCGNQTEWFNSSKTTQISCVNNSTSTQTDDMEEEIERMRSEKDTMIYLLNEIGEMIINQNHLLHNNSTLLGQISEMVLLNEEVMKQKATAANSSKKRKIKHHSIYRFLCRYQKNRKVYDCKKRKIKKIRNVMIQTDLQQLMNKSTQTAIENVNLRKINKFFSYFKTDR